MQQLQRVPLCTVDKALPVQAGAPGAWPAAQDAEGRGAEEEGRKLCLHLREYTCPGAAAATVLSGASAGCMGAPLTPHVPSADSSFIGNALLLTVCLLWKSILISTSVHERKRRALRYLNIVSTFVPLCMVVK